MSLRDERRAEELIALAEAEYGEAITEAEKQVLRDSASSQYPAYKRVRPRPEVRAEFLRWVVTDAKARALLDPQGLRVRGARITGVLDLDECRELPVLVFRRCIFQGTIYLQSAETQGIYVSRSLLAKEFCGDQIRVRGPLQIQNSQVIGEIRLLGAEIAGELSFSSTKLKSKNDALHCDGAVIGGAVFLGPKFESDGTVCFLGIRIQGYLDCSGAKFNAEGNAFCADGAEVDGNAFFSNCIANGSIRLTGTTIHGELDCRAGSFSELSCRNMRLDGDLIWEAIREPEKTDVILVGARVKNLHDDRMSWPAAGHLNLDGLEYEELTLHEESTPEHIKQNIFPKELPLKVEARIEWLMRQPKGQLEEAQPWMQLRALFEKKGDRKSAKHVLFRYKCLRVQKSNWLWRTLCVLYAWVEEEPLRIGWSIGSFLLLGILSFGVANRTGAMMETARLNPSWNQNNLSASYPPFNPVIYTLENAIPVIKLGMDERWMPNSEPAYRKALVWPSERRNLNYYTGLSSYGTLTGLRWILIFAGWAQATVLVAAVAERFKK